MSGVFNILQLVAVTVCFFIIDHVGRRLLAIAGALGEGRGGFVRGKEWLAKHFDMNTGHVADRAPVCGWQQSEEVASLKISYIALLLCFWAGNR